MNEELKEIYELNNSLLQLAENLQGELIKKPITLSPDLGVLRFFFAKASKTAKAVVFLCQEGHPEDALVLVRTIFEIVVKSFYISKSDPIERARAFILYDALKKRKQFRKMAAWNRERMIEDREVEKALKKIEDECDTLEKDPQISRDTLMWPKKHLSELSKEVDLTWEYLTFYWISCLYTHTDIRSCMSFVSETDKGPSFDKKPDDKFTKNVLIYLSDFFIKIIQEFDCRFNLGYQNNISELKEKVEKFMHKQDNVGTGF